MFVPSALAIAAALWIAYLVAIAVEKRIFERPLRAWGFLSRFRKCVVGFVLFGLIAWAGAKPPPPDVGGAPMLGVSGGAPTNAPASRISRIAPSANAAGFVLTGVGTSETFDFSAPEGAFVATNWVRHGAATVKWKV